MRKLTMLIVAAVALMACNTQEVKRISLSANSLQMKVGDMEIIDVNPTDVNVEWTSSDPNVATVKDGVVAAVGVGYSSIRATAGKDYAECQVYVIGAKGETLSITPSIVSLKKGETYQYVYTSTYDVPLTWTSSNQDVATVSETGLVTALSAGNTFITLSNGLEAVTSRVAVEHTWGEYQLVWSDEFNGNALDEGTWSYNIGGSG